MEDPIQVFVGSLDLAAVHSVTQTVLLISDNEDEKYNIVSTFFSVKHFIGFECKIK